MKDIDDGLQALVKEVRARDIRSLVVPALGSGLGGLDWPDVRSRIKEMLGNLNDLHVVVFQPTARRTRTARSATARFPT